MKENIQVVHVAVYKIKVDPMHLFGYAKRYNICKQEVSPLLNPLNNTLTDNKYEMCCLLENQYKHIYIIKYPVSFSPSHATTTRDTDLFLNKISTHHGAVHSIQLHVISCYVTWSNNRSGTLDIYNCVKQGGVISPLPFSICIDNLFLELWTNGLGYHIGLTMQVLLDMQMILMYLHHQFIV